MAASLFDRFVFVDWSARSHPATGENSIWIAEGYGASVRTSNPPTRRHAVERVCSLLVGAAAAGERVLAGFDFPYGYPAGLADALGLEGAAPPWRRTWTELCRLVTDDRRNENNRFEVARALNDRLGSEPGPFWGSPSPRRGLAATKGRFPYPSGKGHLLAEYRLTEQRGRRRRQLSSAWKLHFRPTVGSQALLGIPGLASLRDDPSLVACSQVWPFETGFSLERERRPYVLHCEIWPRVIDVDPAIAASGTLDEAQVVGLVRWASALDGAGRLAPLFTPDVPGRLEREACAAEEGWILGVG